MAAFVRGMFWHLLVAERSNILKKSNDCIVDSKRYVRALKRRPVKVLYPDSETTSKQRSDQIVNKQSQKVASKVRESNAILKNETTNKRVGSMSWSDRNGNASSTSEHTTNLKDQLGGLKFERALPGDKRLARVVSVACSRTFREHQGKILLEGRRLICDALAAGANPQMVFFSSVDRLCDLPLDKLKRATLVKVKFEDIKIWSDLVAPQGVIAIFSRPDPSRLTFPQDQRGQSVPLSLICDNVRDPGNLGTILRCAVAAGCHNVLLTKGCVDAWEPKVLRAAMGAHFRLPIFPSLDWDDIQNQLPKLVTVHVADNCSGSEREVAEEANQSNKPSKVGDYGWVSSRPNCKDMRYKEYESDSDSELSFPRVETKLYHEGWAQGNTGLVIGGETHGLSLEAVQLAERTAGQRLFIPVVPGVDSLNSAMAASILLFEGRRQLLNLMETSGRKDKSKVQFP
ncbi:rRNA methyltransferase 3A, mitochondrial-like isoform X1 [Salvelinus namaycush]|uniref:rRNA methyltransferase 3A, mitochondrial-like isoform X1 n=1 Tax=Salvelinus namaycush TaxID=8040 RepID=A0A8U0P2R8_SALNM|nr:rRNA methyltransferase 3A, mitochondrial-like isoform X1 [Salvelinus namaycush]